MNKMINFLDKMKEAIKPENFIVQTLPLDDFIKEVKDDPLSLYYQWDKETYEDENSNSISVNYHISRVYLLGFITKKINNCLNDILLELDKEISKYILELSNEDSIFTNLWDYCNYIKFGEKVYFEDNDKSRLGCIYVDSDYNADKRIFSINHDRYIVYGELSKVKDPLSDHYLEVFKLKIERKFGREMINQYTIVNNTIKTEDESDALLIHRIYYEICDLMAISYTTNIKAARGNTIEINNTRYWY